MTKVTKIEIRPSTLELQEGEYGLVEAYLEPANATYADIVWTTDNSNIATVNSGHIVAKKRGTTKIKAVSLCDVSVKGECTLTVIPPKRVQGISFPKAEYTMTLGIPDYIFPNFTPSDALNKDLTWCCYDESIISVTDGLVTPKAAGTTPLIAVSTDGSYTASCTIRVVLDNVSIRKIGDYTEVHFEKGNKTWKCIGVDMIYDSANSANISYIEMLNDNFFKSDCLEIDNIYDYSYDELRLLYAIDPYSVAAYVEKYAQLIVRYNAIAQNKKVEEEMLKYKDEVFKELFGREPNYFKRVANATYEWVKTNDTSDFDAVLSESESLFGLHRIHDGITHATATDAWLKFAAACIQAVVGMSKVASVIVTSLEQMVITFQILSTTDEQEVANKLIKSYAKTGIDLGFTNFDTDLVLKYPNEVEVEFDKFNIIGWAKAIATGIGGLNDVLESSIVGKDFCEEIIYYYSNTTNYNVKIITLDGQEYTMQSVYDALIELRK